MEQNFFKFDQRIAEASKKALAKCEKKFKEIDENTEYNQQKVLNAYIENRVSESHFVETTGYGYGDRGRDTLDAIYAMTFGTEDALVRHTFACGTHTLGVALFGVLRPGDIMLSATGTPYDTIHPVIGLNGEEGMGSLKDYGVTYDEVALKEDGRPDMEKIIEKTKEIKPALVYIQRSRGYSLRPSYSAEEIGEIAQAVHAIDKNIIVFVDNCYGEFVETVEPTELGADIMAGSLIKNVGGGIAKNGGYIAGRADLIEKCSYRMTVPGLGREVGATLGQNRELFMGFFNAPHITGEALKTAVFTAALFEELGFDVTPRSDEMRCDIIQAVQLRTPEALIAFCQGMQSGAPVDAFVVPEPWDMPGYDSKVIMAAGAFTMGSSIELSADAPLREPYAAWMQGGFNFHSAKMGVMLAAQKMIDKGVL